MRSLMILISFIIVFYSALAFSDNRQGSVVTKGVVMDMPVTSKSFSNNHLIPTTHSGDGKDLSPHISWQDTPQGTKEFVLIADDPDAPTPNPWVHWVVYKIPPEIRELQLNLPQRATLPDGIMQGKNSWDAIGYRGPMPPKGHGKHHYRFKLYALDTTLNVEPGIKKDDLIKVISGHVIGEGEIVGTYER